MSAPRKVRGILDMHMHQQTRSILASRPSKADLEALQRFNGKVERLERSKFAQRFADDVPNVSANVASIISVEDAGPGSLTITCNIRSDLDDFDEEEIDAFLLTLRLFSQDNDSISLRNMAAIYAADWMPSEAKERFDEARAAVNAFLDDESVISLEDGRPLRTSEIVDVVVYGGLAHTNPSKAAVLEEWMQSCVRGFILAEFYAYAKKMLDYLVFFKSLNQAVLEAIRQAP
jgi:hypothetical protein